MKKPTFKQRFEYWLDEKMSKGTISMVKFLLIGTVLVVIIVSLIVHFFDLAEESRLPFVIWDNMAYTLNAWLPFSSDMENPTFSYLVPTAIASVAGVLFTSILIGLFSSAIEEKVLELRKGNSVVLENNHIVVLGFVPGSYALIQELMNAASGKPVTILVAGDTEKDEMEDLIRSNTDIPNNAKIICRNVDVSDPQALACCSIPNARTVVISPINDEMTVKAILATVLILEGNERPEIKIIASVKSHHFVLPKNMLKHNNIMMLQTGDTIAKLISRSCTQNGIAELFDGLFNFDGSEFYSEPLKEVTGKSFAQVVCAMEKAVPVGFIRNNQTMLNPSPETVMEKNDRLIYLSGSRMEYSFTEESFHEGGITKVEPLPEENKQIVVFGYNESFETMVSELPDSIDAITLVETNENSHAFTSDFVCAGRKVTLYEKDFKDDENLKGLVCDAEHIVILNNHDYPDDRDCDIENIVLLINLRDIKEQYGYKYSITAEMVKESSRMLVKTDDPTDYIVASNISSMFLAQMVESPELVSFYREMLSDEGNEIYLKKAGMLRIQEGDYSIQELRTKALECGYILLGFADEGRLTMNPDLHDKVNINDTSCLALLGED